MILDYDGHDKLPMFLVRAIGENKPVDRATLVAYARALNRRCPDCRESLPSKSN